MYDMLVQYDEKLTVYIPWADPIMSVEGNYDGDLWGPWAERWYRGLHGGKASKTE